MGGYADAMDMDMRWARIWRAYADVCGWDGADMADADIAEMAIGEICAMRDMGHICPDADAVWTMMVDADISVSRDDADAMARWARDIYAR